MAELRDVMTPKQVAEYLQLHPMTIYRYINNGKIPAAKIGGRYRIKRETVEELLAEMHMEEQAATTEEQP
jgi:excisionase family DNA binding protein